MHDKIEIDHRSYRNFRIHIFAARILLSLSVVGAWFLYGSLAKVHELEVKLADKQDITAEVQIAADEYAGILKSTDPTEYVSSFNLDNLKALRQDFRAMPPRIQRLAIEQVRSEIPQGQHWPKY